MYVKSLELKNFRNYDSLSLEFKNGTNILYGDNAQGKTNALESIYMCCTSKSHRGNKDKEIIKFGEEEGHIKLIIMKDEVPYRIDMHLKSYKNKGIAVNGVPLKRITELFGVGNVVFFSPEDLSIIKNGPAERRKFIDTELCQSDKIYAYNLSSYLKVLMQKNKLLKDLKFNRDNSLYDTLDVWDLQLAEYGSKIIERRSLFINDINEIIYDIHKSISGGKENLQLRYEPNIKGNNFYEELVKNRDKDIYYKTTSVGPHRDDISFFVDEMDLRKYGSQGQQRTAALSLKLSEIEFVKKIIGDVPILLLDDVLSELDSNRQRQLLNSIDGVQTIITCTGLDEFIENRFNIDNIYKISEGKVIENNNLSL